MMRPVEYWVMRVIASKEETQRMIAKTFFEHPGSTQLMNDLSEGLLVVLNSGELAEPVECLTSQSDALIAAQKDTARYGKPCQVIMSVLLEGDVVDVVKGSM